MALPSTVTVSTLYSGRRNRLPGRRTRRPAASKSGLRHHSDCHTHSRRFQAEGRTALIDAPAASLSLANSNPCMHLHACATDTRRFGLRAAKTRLKVQGTGRQGARCRRGSPRASLPGVWWRRPPACRTRGCTTRREPCPGRRDWNIRWTYSPGTPTPMSSRRQRTG